jgi:dolichol-phosphate mannosyltransferase
MIRQFLKYCIVGGSGVVINLGATYLLTERMGMWYILSNCVGISIAMVTNFLLNKYWTFKPEANNGM